MDYLLWLSIPFLLCLVSGYCIFNYLIKPESQCAKIQDHWYTWYTVVFLVFFFSLYVCLLGLLNILTKLANNKNL